MLQHILQSHIPYLNQQYLNNPSYIDDGACFFFPGDHVTDECGFCIADSSITIPYLPKSDLCDFIYCVFLTKGSTKYGGRVSCSIYQDGIKVGWVLKYYKNLISDHVLFCYHGIKKFDRIS